VAMSYFGIKTPPRDGMPGYIWWIADSRHGSWMSFFKYPNKEREMNSHTYPLADAIRAYEGIGYKCVELEVLEKGES
jgi:hypothetical protein